MNVSIKEKRLKKETDKLPTNIKVEIAAQIKLLKEAKTLNDVPNVRQIKGTEEPYYRLKFGDYRIILYYLEEIQTAKIITITHRKDTYKKHNLPWNN